MLPKPELFPAVERMSIGSIAGRLTENLPAPEITFYFWLLFWKDFEEFMFHKNPCGPRCRLKTTDYRGDADMKVDLLHLAAFSKWRSSSDISFTRSYFPRYLQILLTKCVKFHQLMNHSWNKLNSWNKLIKQETVIGLFFEVRGVTMKTKRRAKCIGTPTRVSGCCTKKGRILCPQPSTVGRQMSEDSFAKFIFRWNKSFCTYAHVMLNAPNGSSLQNPEA